MKKFFAVMLALTLVLVSIPAFASARVIVPNNICRPYYGRPCGYYAAPVCYGDPVIPNLTYFVPGEAYCAPVYPAFVPAYRVPAKKAPAIILNPELVKVEKTVAATSLNVRKGPGTDYEVLGSLILLRLLGSYRLRQRICICKRSISQIRSFLQPNNIKK